MNELAEILDIQKAKELSIDVTHHLCWKLKVQDLDRTRISTLDFECLNLPREKIMLAQSICLQFLEIETFSHGIFVTEPSFDKCKSLLFILEVLHQEYPNARTSDLSLNDLNSAIIIMLFTCHSSTNPRGTRTLQKTDTPKSKQRLENVISSLKLWHNIFVQGHVSDGPSYLVTSKLLMPALKSIFGSSGIDIHGWAQGGTYGSVPFIVCHLLLADALEVVGSLKSKQLATYYSIVQQNNSHHHLNRFWSPSKRLAWRQYRLSSDIHGLAHRMRESRDVESRACLVEFAEPLHQAIAALNAEVTDDKHAFPWPSYSDLCNDYREVISAIIVIFLSVMGKRGPSEVGTLRATDIKIPLDGKNEYATVHPAIFKTHQGQRLSHGITSYIDEAFLLALTLGNTYKSGTDLPLFSAPPTLTDPSAPPKRLSSDRLNAYLHAYYASFCARVSSKVDFDVKQIHETITSHQFRHSFAEFALRRYDGNVEELLRQHFVHAFDHWWTKRYTADKLDEDHIQGLNNAYIKELIPHIAFDSNLDPNYVGGMALFIRSIIDEQVLSLPPSEVEKHINSLCDEITSITAHEYGWCIVLKDFSTQAKCADSAGSPSPTSTSPEKCIGCVNFCASKKSHLDANTKIVISHLDFLEQKVWRFPKMKDRSRRAVINSQKLFPELKSLGVPDDA